MTNDERILLKQYFVHSMLRYDQDLDDARKNFRASENAWSAFQLALASERKNTFDHIAAQIYALLNIWG